MRYRIEVSAPLPPDLAAAAERVAGSFGIPPERVLTLLDRAPGIVTKPIDEREADRVIAAFGEAGIWARAVPYDPNTTSVLERVLDAAGSEPARARRRRRAEVGSVPVFDVAADAAARPVRSRETAPPSVRTDAGDPVRARPASAPLRADVAAPDRADAGDPVRARSAPDSGRIEPIPATDRADVAAEDDRSQPDPDSEWVELGARPPATDEAAPYPEAVPPPPAEASGPDATVGDSAFDARAFTRALLSEHGLDESLLDDLDELDFAGEPPAPRPDDAAERNGSARARGGGVSTAERPRSSPFLSKVEEPMDRHRDVIAVPVRLESDDPPSFVRETAASARAARPRRSRSRRGLHSKVLLAGLVPALLTAVFALAAIALTVRPVLRAQQAEGASSAATAFAVALSPRLIDAVFDSPAAVAELQRTALDARLALRRDGIAFLLVTDLAGVPLAGWSQDSDDPVAVKLALGPVVTATLEAMFGLPDGSDGAVADPPEITAPERVAAAAPLLVEGNAVGAVMLGSEPGRIGRRSGTVLLIALAAVLIPLLIAFVVTVALTGSLLHNLEYLTRAADRISRGKLSRPVELATGDELSDLARAIERMRISLQEGMERLRRRRL